MQLPPKLHSSALTILIDSREKRPYAFPAFKTETARLITGDYTIPGLETFTGIERKTPADFAFYLSRHRTQLESQIQRLLKLAHPLVIIEAAAPEFDETPWRNAGVVDLNLLRQTLRSWRARDLPIVHVPTHAQGAFVARDFLFDMATNYYKTHCAFCQHVDASFNSPPIKKRAA